MTPTWTEARERQLAAFCDAYPSYTSTRALDDLRAADFARLDAQDHVYLDYAGGGLYAESQVRRHAELLLSSVFGNPHSFNPTSSKAEELVHVCRYHVLEFFNASPDEYTVVFTSNASHALKLVGEAYPFGEESTFLLTFDNHNSVNGIREFARTKGARISYVPMQPPDLRVDDGAVGEALRLPGAAGHRLFAFPAQSNFSGVQHPLEWIEQAQAAGWEVLLDAAAFVPTNRLDLARWHPDFVALSFYKMFGYPTGVGALIARRQALEKLRRPWFAGGTIAAASVQADRYQPAPGAAAFEEGTVNYLTIPAVEDGLRLLERVGLDVVHERVACLTGWMLDALGALMHDNGEPLVRFYGPATRRGRGGTIAFNFCGRGGRLLDHRVVERRAARERISLRTGSFCNPGAGETALGLSKEELDDCFRRFGDWMRPDDFHRCIDSKSSGAVRVSFGLVSNFADAQAMVAFAARFLGWGDDAQD